MAIRDIPLDDFQKWLDELITDEFVEQFFENVSLMYSDDFSFETEISNSHNSWINSTKNILEIDFDESLIEQTLATPLAA